MLFRQNGRTTQNMVGQLSKMTRNCPMSRLLFQALVTTIININTTHITVELYMYKEGFNDTSYTLQ